VLCSSATNDAILEQGFTGTCGRALYIRMAHSTGVHAASNFAASEDCIAASLV